MLDTLSSSSFGKELHMLDILSSSFGNEVHTIDFDVCLFLLGINFCNLDH